jgi:hypothetical protein
MPIHSYLAPRRRFFSCCICNEFVELETAKIDEFGQPVHEECYMQKIILKRSIRPPPKASDAIRPGSQAIINFLTTEQAHLVTNFCPVCGSRLEHRKSIFFFEGKTWEIPLSVCLDCEEITNSSPFDA